MDSSVSRLVPRPIRTSMFALVAVLALVASAACGAGTGADTGTGTGTSQNEKSVHRLNVGFIAEPRSLDFTQDDGAAIPQALLTNVYEGLVEIDPQGKIVPGLAESWKVSEDRTVYTFQLQDDVHFTNGARFTAKDAVFSIERVKTEWKPALKSGMDVVEKAEAVDPTTLKVTLKRPSNMWLYRMTTRIGAMFSRSGVDNLAVEPVGTGPYTVQNWRRGDALILARNEKYWGDKPWAEKVELKYFRDPNAMNNALLSGSIDIISTVQAPESLARFENKEKFEIIEGTTNGEVVLSFNNSAKPLQDKRVRKAIKYALDRQEIIDAAWSGHGQLIGSMVPPTDPWYEDLTDLYPHDPDKARKLLAAAGKKNLELRLRIPSTLPYAVASAQVVQSQLREVGIKAVIDELEFPDRWLNEVYTKADYDMSIISHVEPWDIVLFGDPDYYWRYDSKKFRQLIEEADRGTKEEQIEKMQQAARLLAEDAASDWLFVLPNLMVTTSQVQGLPENLTSEAFDLTTISKSE